MNAQKRQEIFRRFQQACPHPKTELQYTSSFELLIAVMLSAQTTDVSVNKATRKLFPIANTPESIMGLGEVGLMPYLQTINLFRTKARHIIATCQQLLTLHQGEVPHERKALEALPGVGRKTANVILNTVFGQSTIAVDTHLFRVANRTRLASGKTVRAVEDRLMKVIPKTFLHHAHHWLVLHGRYICTARAPRCSTCVMMDLCEYPNKKGG